MAAKVLELAGNAARNNKKIRIIDSNLQLAIGNEEELNKILSRVTIALGSDCTFTQHSKRKLIWIFIYGMTYRCKLEYSSFNPTAIAISPYSLLSNMTNSCEIIVV